jgi:hypothetical protein
MFVYRSRFLTRGEVWFDAEPDATRVDWIYHRQRSHPLGHSQCNEFYTRLVNLQKTPPELLAEMDEKTARRILDARDKDRLRCEHCDSSDKQLMDEIEVMWNRFAVAQKTPLFERHWLEQFIKAGELEVVGARDGSGTVLGYHLVFLTPKRARQLFAIAPYKAVPDIAWRNAVSRANCYIHWHNFLTYHEQGVSHFDFGGWYRGTTDIRLLGINTFKKSFGGTVVREFDCEQPVTIKGRVLLTLARILAGLRTARPPQPESDGKTTIKREPNKVSPAFR